MRLIGMDSPEIGHEGRPSQPLADAARIALLQVAGRGSALGLQFDEQHYDRYGRVLAHVFLADGTNVEARMLRQGLATALVIPPDLRYLGCYQQAEARARAARAGIWALPRYQPVAAEDLPRDATGFHVITGRVRHVGHSRSAVWLDLTRTVALRIPREDLRYFTGYRPDALAGRRVRARGWLSPHHGELRMTVRHPAALEVVE